MPLQGEVDKFIVLSRGATSLGEIQALLESKTLDMGFDYYALVQHVDVRRASNRETIWLHNYPESWAKAFVSGGLFANDPMMMASQKTSTGFRWSEVGKLIKLSAHHKRVLAQAALCGMGDGFTVPAHLPGESNASCNFSVRVGRELPERNLMMAQLIGLHAFEGARRVIGSSHRSDAPRLTPRQLDCLVYVARGKSDWEIAQILGIKEHTVRDYIEDACQRYDVRRRVQLVLRAIHDGQLLLADTIG